MADSRLHNRQSVRLRVRPAPGVTELYDVLVPPVQRGGKPVNCGPVGRPWAAPIFDGTPTHVTSQQRKSSDQATAERDRAVDDRDQVLHAHLAGYGLTLAAGN